jgi:hypothetical protein
MRDHEAAMCAYAQLALLSHEKQQALSRDRFLLLTGVTACRAGWPTVAAECHALLGKSPLQVTQFGSFEDALRDDDFRRLADHWERWCPFERAEHLLQASADRCGSPLRPPRSTSI